MCPEHARGKVGNILLPHMQKPREALDDAYKSIPKEIESKQWTYCSSFMSRTWFYSLAPLFWLFWFLIRNFNSFCSSFYYCNWHKNSYPKLIPGTKLIKNGSSFPPPRLFRATRLFGREEYTIELKALYGMMQFRG